MNNDNATKKEFALTPEIRQQLRVIAKTLPPLPIHVQTYGEVDGSVLIDKGYQSFKQHGKTETIIIGKKYTVPNGHEVKDINHFSNLFDQYKTGGIIAVHSYILSLVEHEQKAREHYPELFEDEGKGKYIAIGGLEKLN